jgi:threonine aldolase
MPSDEDLFRLRKIMACQRILSGVRPATIGDRLAELDRHADREELPDRYGDGAVERLEQRVAQLLGKPAAAFFPTGTMAQQVALRCWALRSGSWVVALHPSSHPQVHERHAHTLLSGLAPVYPTTAPRQPTAAEIRACEPFGTLMLELPLRDPGYLLPSWDELVEMVAAARERATQIHFDGARLWECTTHFDHDLTEIAALADSVYVSFYKSLGGQAGAALAGSAEFIAAVLPWRHRYGGRQFEQWPAAISALAGLDEQLPRLASYVAHAKVIAAALAELPGAVIHPDPPHTHQFQLWLPHPAKTLNDAALAMAEREQVSFIHGWREVAVPGLAMAEVTVAAAALEWTVEQVRQAGLKLLSMMQR